jgi:hypothetical protein
MRQQPYRVGPRASEAVQIEVERMLSMNGIEPSISELAALMVLVPKPDGSIRFCIDYINLTAITERNFILYLEWMTGWTVSVLE